MIKAGDSKIVIVMIVPLSIKFPIRWQWFPNNAYSSNSTDFGTWLPIASRLHAWKSPYLLGFNTLKPGHHGRYFPDRIFKCDFLNVNVEISNTRWVKFFPIIQHWFIWWTMLVTHICVTRPQWVKVGWKRYWFGIWHYWDFRLFQLLWYLTGTLAAAL